MRRLLLLLLICSMGASAPEKVGEYSLVRVTLDAGESAAVFADGLSPVDSAQTSGGLVFVGPPGRYAILVFKDGMIQPPLFVQIVKGNPGPTPGPTPGPDPVDPVDPVVIPEGVAGDVYREAIKIGDPAGAAKLGENYEKIASMIAAGAYNSSGLQQCKLDLISMNKGLGAKWKPFGLWLGAETNKRAQTLDNARTFFEQVSIGLGAIK